MANSSTTYLQDADKIKSTIVQTQKLLSTSKYKIFEGDQRDGYGDRYQELPLENLSEALSNIKLLSTSLRRYKPTTRSERIKKMNLADEVERLGEKSREYASVASERAVGNADYELHVANFRKRNPTFGGIAYTFKTFDKTDSSIKHASTYLSNLRSIISGSDIAPNIRQELSSEKSKLVKMREELEKYQRHVKKLTHS